MAKNIILRQENNRLEWDKFVSDHFHGGLYHLMVWVEAITHSYAHEIHSLIAVNWSDDDHSLSISQNKKAYPIDFLHNKNSIIGLFPLVYIQHWLFGNSLISMPFCDAGGVLAADENVERMLIEQSLRSADKLHVPILELRQYQPLTCLNDQKFVGGVPLFGAREVKVASGWHVSSLPNMNKVRMLIELSGDPGTLMRKFKPKLRSQIRKPIKEGLTVKIGGVELIDDFYNVFAENMRDLGSPVHSKKFISEAVKAFPTANIFIVYSNHKPLAGSVTIGFKDTLSNPWASSLRRYSHLAPNMLLYWSMLEFSCQNGYRRFDFGRSTPGEGTYKFKEQWGAKPEPLYWYRFSKTGDQGWSRQPDKDKMSKVIEYWKKLPVPVAKIIGPRIRKYISL